MKRILHFISSGGLYGAEKLLLLLAAQLQARGSFVTIGALHDVRDPHLEVIEEAKKLGLKTEVFQSRGRWDWGTVSTLKRYLQENRFDLLHTHNYKSDLIGLWASRRLGIPMVATAHGFTDMNRSVSYYEQLDRWILSKYFSKVVVVTPQILPSIPANKRRVIPNGIDISAYCEDSRRRVEFRKHWGIADSDVLIATIGRFSKEKNQKLLIEAASQLLKSHKNLKFMLVGGGNLKQELKQQVKDLEMENSFVFTGVLSDMPTVYQGIDIFVLSSLTEGVPLTILEAMASGLPVVATSVGGIPEILTTEQSGILIDRFDPGELEKALERLIQDRSLAVRLGTRARDHVREHFSLSKMTEQYEQIYNELVK